MYIVLFRCFQMDGSAQSSKDVQASGSPQASQVRRCESFRLHTWHHLAILCRDVVNRCQSLLCCSSFSLLNLCALVSLPCVYSTKDIT